jgi:hypothetical protein
MIHLKKPNSVTKKLSERIPLWMSYLLYSKQVMESSVAGEKLECTVEKHIVHAVVLEVGVLHSSGYQI